MNARFSISSGISRRAYGLSAVAILAAALLACLVVPPPAALAKDSPKGGRNAQARLERLGWLTGCWEQRTKARLVQEQWMEPRGGTMLGMGRTTRGDALLEYEQVRIYERGGKLVYEAHPSGQAPDEFVSTELGDSVVVFENPEHDFPQRIVYCRVGLDSLVARVEGTVRGKKRSVQFHYIHIACPSGGTSPTR